MSQRRIIAAAADLLRIRKSTDRMSGTNTTPTPGRSPFELPFNYRLPSTPGGFLRGARRPSPPKWTLVELKPDNGCVNIVGESFYQPALVAITGRRKWVEVHHDCTAILVLEPQNPHDPHAVRVEIDGRLVGYLSRTDAASYGPCLKELAKHHKRPYCQAFIKGRGPGADTPNMGVFLYIPPANQGLIAA
jgi:HIRAN domain